MTIPRIELEHLGKTFTGEGRTLLALKDVSMQVHPGEFVTLIGPSGSGKSSVVKAGLIPALRDGARPVPPLGVAGAPQRAAPGRGGGTVAGRVLGGRETDAPHSRRGGVCVQRYQGEDTTDRGEGTETPETSDEK